MKKIKALEAWNLAPGDLAGLSNRATVLIHLPYPDLGPYLPYPPAERRQRMARTLRETLKALKRLLAGAPVELAAGTRMRPRAVRTVVPLHQVAALAAEQTVGSLHLEAIEGRTRTEKEPGSPKATFWSIKARYVAQVEHATTGGQLYEDRLMLVKAAGEEEAREKLRPSFQAYAEPYLNSDGRLVSWQFETFLDAYDTGVEEIEAFLNPEGVEVFSEWKRRKTKPAPAGNARP